MNEERKKIREDAMRLHSLISDPQKVPDLHDIDSIKITAMGLYSFGVGEVFQEADVNSLLSKCLNAGTVLKNEALQIIREECKDSDLTYTTQTITKIIVLLLGCQLYLLTRNSEEKKKHIREVTNELVSSLLATEAVSKKRFKDEYNKLQKENQNDNDRTEN